MTYKNLHGSADETWNYYSLISEEEKKEDKEKKDTEKENKKGSKYYSLKN